MTLIDELERLARERAREWTVPGVAIGLLRDDVAEVVGVGVADVRTAQPVTPDTVFSIASITKTMTATVLASLVDRGALDFDAPVRTYAPEFALADESLAERVTVRHLLTHTGGWIGEEIPGSDDGHDALARAAAACASLPQLTPPGALFSYNNAGFAVAGRVAEAAGGRRYEDEVQELVFGPIGMTRSGFSPRHDADAAAEHTVRDGRPVAIAPWSTARTGRPVGGARSSARDLLAYAHAGLSGLGGVLSAARAAELVTPTVPCAGPGRGVALAWFVEDRAGTRIVSHEGATVTHMSLLALVPARRAALIVLTNGANGVRVYEAVRHRFLEVIGVPLPAEQTTRERPANELTEYAGRYEWPTSDLELTPAGGGLTLTLTWKGIVAARPPLAPVQLSFYDTDRVVTSQRTYADFVRDDAGRIRLFRFGNRARPRVP